MKVWKYDLFGQEAGKVWKKAVRTGNQLQINAKETTNAPKNRKEKNKSTRQTSQVTICPRAVSFRELIRELATCVCANLELR